MTITAANARITITVINVAGKYTYSSLTSSFLTVEVRIESLVAHLSDLLNVAFLDPFEKAAQVAPRVQCPQRLLLQLEHLVHPPLVLKLLTHTKARY